MWVTVVYWLVSGVLCGLLWCSGGCLGLCYCGVVVGVWDCYVGYGDVVVNVWDSYVGYGDVVIGVWGPMWVTLV